jgi:ribosomal protein S12 methylthiotransferase
MRFYILTLGCPKNTVDSEGMTELLRAAGHEPTESPDEADILIVNTCAFIEPAKEESLASLTELARSKTADQRLIAAGCMIERYGPELATMVPSLDGLIGTRRWREITSLTEDLLREDTPGLLHHLPEPGPHYPPVHPVPRRCPSTATAYVKIADGCDAPCAFCTIPQIKGPYRSKPKEAVLSEVQELALQGVKEIILIAQDTTAYGHDWGQEDALPALINDIVRVVPDLPWLRIMYTYPQRITHHLIETMALHPQVCHYLDLPLQHAHHQVLRRMNRPHDIKSIDGLVAQLREAMPDIALRTTFIVGYPGETEEEFEALLTFMKGKAFDRAGIFIYSQEEGTRAAKLPNQLPQEIKEDRYGRAMALQQHISLGKNRRFVGHVLNVLVEGAGDGISIGRSYRDAPEVDGVVLVRTELPVNEFASVRVTEAIEYDLIADLG